ncbi:glycosyltransferase family 4 protein [Virgibacillus xinjiangensis]|uniref:Glycosyltransferase family 4 protein n=1 Tax=Virgibacillus xinjiangensis TaxID=393090 RepID=A0ABV7CVE5_9BACI
MFYDYTELTIAFFISLIASFLLTYLVKSLALKIGAVDHPDHRKIHQEPVPRIGGLAIFFGAVLGVLYIQPAHDSLIPIAFGALVIIITGFLDDLYTIRPIIKLTGQLIATSFLISSGLIIDRLTLPIIGMVDLGFFSVMITVLWVVGITNAINLIDGLDGLATGVSTIALTTIFIMSLIDTQVLVAYISIALIGANLGFLYHNFYPAKLYMGDTGSNFLGYMIAVVSILGLFKEVAIFSFIIPVIILAVPILDTALAIFRRAYRRENIMGADNKHLHYELLAGGYSHRKTVLIIYGFSALFGLMAILLSNASTATVLIVTFLVLSLLHIFAELAGVVLGGRRPIVNTLRKILRKLERGRGK